MRTSLWQFLSAIAVALCLIPSCSRRQDEPERANAEKEIIIQGPFDGAHDFSCGLGLVQTGRWDTIDEEAKQYYLDTAGRVVLAIAFEDSCQAFPFAEDMAAVNIGFSDTGSRSDGKWGYIDKRGKIVIRPQFDYAEGFSEGLARIRIGLVKAGKWGFVDKTGAVVIKPEYIQADDFRDGLARVYIGGRWGEVTPVGGKWGFIDKTGSRIIETELDYVESFSEGFAKFRKDGKWGFIDTSGRTAIQPKYDYVADFSEGLCAVEIGASRKNGIKGLGKWGFIDKTGRMVIDPVYDWVGRFSEGLAWVIKGSARAGDCCDYIDTTGKVIIRTKYPIARDFSQGRAAVAIGVLWASSKGLETTWGYIDKTGKTVIEPQYDYAHNFSEGMAVVDCSPGEIKYLYIDTTGAPMTQAR